MIEAFRAHKDSLEFRVFKAYWSLRKILGQEGADEVLWSLYVAQAQDYRVFVKWVEWYVGVLSD
jgi:hypothetical protein